MYDLNKNDTKYEGIRPTGQAQSCKNAYGAQVSEAAEGAERVASV